MSPSATPPIGGTPAATIPSDVNFLACVPKAWLFSGKLSDDHGALRSVLEGLCNAGC